MQSMLIVPGQPEIGDFVKKRSLTLDGVQVARTPLLLPSFSSKGFPDVKKILKFSEELVDSEMLISAYDIHYNLIEPPFDFASMIFLDSGGYEASKDADLSDIGDKVHIPREWSLEAHQSVLDEWESTVPAVFISYDHPKERLSIPDQIDRANKNLGKYPNAIHEILLKPETGRQTLLKLDSVIPHINELAKFNVIGVTEKEIGNSILSRMSNIAILRKALIDGGFDTPIHVFGSLDTMTTPLYFVAGADIFDGLTWLRYAYMDGYTIYKQNYGALVLGSGIKSHMIEVHCWFNNYYYLKELELELRRFLNDHDFNGFKYHANTIKHCYESMVESLEV